MNLLFFSFQKNRILNEIKNQTEQILKLVFENYKSLDESSFSGMNDVVSSATGVPAPALAPAVKVYMLLHDILSPKDQSNLCNYFQVKHTPSQMPYFILLLIFLIYLASMLFIGRSKEEI